MQLRVHADNARALRCYEKCGFAREGVLRKDMYTDGKYSDSVIMGILQEDWERTRPAQDYIIKDKRLCGRASAVIWRVLIAWAS